MCLDGGLIALDLGADTRFWSIALPFALGLMAQVGFLTHQIALLAPDLGIEGAGFAVALTTGTALAARIGLGLIIDRLNQRWVTAVSLASQALALALGILVQLDGPVAWYGGCVLFGCSVGNLITLPALIVQREYPRAQFALVVSMTIAVSQVAFSFGPAVPGVMRDLFGHYDQALLFCIAVELIGAVIIVARPRNTARRRRELASDHAVRNA